jgi:hypothetical protein
MLTTGTWLEDGDVSDRLRLQQARLHEWAADDPSATWRRDPREMLLEAVFGRAAPDDDIFSDLDS